MPRRTLSGGCRACQRHGLGDIKNRTRALDIAVQPSLHASVHDVIGEAEEFTILD